MTIKRAIQAIDRHGLLLVFPIKNRTEPNSLWSVFYPRSEMRWEWDEGGDNRVAELWRLREALSRSGRVVYAKWFQGRATFISRELFPALFRSLNPLISAGKLISGLSPDSRLLLSKLDETSPLSTKELKQVTGMAGKFYESQYHRGLRELWTRLLIVGYGEVDDGAFPSLAMGSSQLMFEDLWNSSLALPYENARSQIQMKLNEDSAFFRFFLKHSVEAQISQKIKKVKNSPTAEIRTVTHSDLTLGKNRG